MKYNKKFITCLFISMIGSIYAQDNIINEIAKGGKFIVRDVEQKEAMVIEEGNVGFSGTLKLGVLPKGDISNSIVVWDPDDKLFKILDQELSTGLTNNFKDEGWHTLDYDGLADDNTTTISASVQGTASVKWNKFSTDYGYIQLGPANSSWAHIYTDRPRFIFNRDVWSWPGGFSSYYYANLYLKTGGNTRLTILKSNGNVGIGTTNPSTKLDVEGQVKIRGGYPGYGKVLTSDATGLATWQTPAAGGGSTLWTESGSNIYRTSGNIGIGTTNPSAKLDVAGQVKITGGTPGYGKVLTSDATGLATWQELPSNDGVNAPSWNKFSTDYGYIRLGPANNSWAHIYTDRSRFIFNRPVYSFYGTFRAYRNYNLRLETNRTPRLTILASNGNIGIGTTNPSVKLDVAGQVKIRGGDHREQVKY